MKKNTVQEEEGHLARNYHNRIWKKTVIGLACVVIFCTVHALILPAATLEKTPQCGKTEHTHSEACYTQKAAESEAILVCTPESLGLHRHTDVCLNGNGEYCCGYSDFVVHTHDTSCFDAEGNLWCPFPEIKAHTHEESCYTYPETEPLHTHTDECYSEDGILICELSTESVPAEPSLICGKEDIILHEHSSGCFDGNGNLICGTPQVLEHVHTDACFQNTEGSADTEELTCDLEEHTHSAACPVIGMIEALPTRQSVEERIAAFEEAGDEAGSEAYLAELKTQVQEACDAYAALPEEEQAKVTNVERLTALEWLFDLTQQDTAAVTVTNQAGDSVNVTLWTGDTGNAQKHLQTALFSVEQGYTIQTVEYYQIDGLTGSRASVSYGSGGLNADNGAQIFVYALGADGAAASHRCVVENPAQKEGFFKSFDFEIPVEIQEGSSDASNVYAFISARPATLEEMGIYCGTEQADGIWVAYDGPTEAEANVKATITLPGGMTAPEGYRPFIRKINEGEGFYPDNNAVLAKAGEINGWQCYTIRWIKQDADRLYMLPLNDGGTVTVEIDYVKDDARLSGPAGARKLLIFNSDADGSLVEQVADTVENVQVEGDSYDKFTFQAAQAGPYVFVSKKVEKGYIDALSIKSVIDGSDAFDADDEPGNDSSDSNKIVRSYDTIQYDLDATFGAREEGVTQKTVNMYFELTLRKSATAARFDISKMLWLGENYSVEYLDDGGNVIMIMDHDSKYYLPKMENGVVVRDEHGFAQADHAQPTVSMNAQLSGSTSGRDSYKVSSGGVAMQRLVGWTELHAGEGESILSGTQSFSTAVEVRNADNGEIFAPAFKMWLEGNEENYGKETLSQGGGLEPAQPDTDNVVDVSAPENKQYEVRVSAGTNFNVQLKKNDDMSYKNWFDFSTGQAVAEPARSELERLASLKENHGKSNPAEFTENGSDLSEDTKAEYANYRYGRLTCYGITLQLYNDTENKDNLANKNIRGMSLPVGNITFDLKFDSTAKSGDETIDSDAYTPILWDYNENVPAHESYTNNYVDPGRGTVTTPGDGRGNGGRNLYWDGEPRSPYAKGGAPSNYLQPYNGCYYGGGWTLVDESGEAIKNINQVAHPTVVTGDGENTTYHFSVSDYDFDFDKQHFPTQDAGNSGDIPGYNSYIRCFSAGCVQVLSVFPRVQKVSEAEIFLNTTVSNLSLTTRAGQELKAQPGDASKFNHEVNKEDNITSDQIVLYAPGGLTKGSSFNGKNKNDQPPNATSEGFLGTDYWTTSYDCSTFAGDDIWIMGYGMITAGSDYRTRSMNLLQLFDSEALSIRDDPAVYQKWDVNYGEEGGTPSFLYAADPDYPEGYDTNHQDNDKKYDVVAYMNTVREEDLVYSSVRPDENGYITVNNQKMKCIGVLMELRGCNLRGGGYQYVRIPVKVNGDNPNLVGKTVATVNTFRVWSYDLKDGNNQPITWANGQWDAASGKNHLEGFDKPTNSVQGDKYSGELANGGGLLANGKGSSSNYVKTEYQDNLQVKGTHAGGTLSGNSLLILNYKAGVNIGVDNKESTTGMISYNIGDGETVVDYRLKNIRTDVSDRTSQTERPTTELTIDTFLDKDYTGAQRISVSGDSYRINGYAVDAFGNVADEETSIAIGTDPNHPVQLEFDASDGKRYRIKVYAQMGANSQSIKFVIQDAPVGLYLPDITFQANFAAVTALKNNDTIKADTYISGTSDKRAYDPTKGNTDNITVGIILRSSTNLTKAVNRRYIELDGAIAYDVTYTNSGTDKINKIYFYDLLPHTEDIRGSAFDGDVVLRKVDVTSSKENGAEPADATVYYSKTEYKPLYDKVSKFGEGGNVAEREADVEEMLKDTDFFQPLGQVRKGKFVYDSAFDAMSDAEKIREMTDITGLYVKVENLHKGQTVNMQITVQAENNAADNWYKNIANSWIAGSGTLPLTSNKVETQVISRAISGIVWHDKNLNGIRDDGEPRLEDVKATLFKVDAKGNYGLCTKDVTGKDISPVTTEADGAYSFDRLEAGNYIVAFSGDALKEYTGATVYQQNGKNDSNTNDGKALGTGKTKAFDIKGYDYYIQYTVENESMLLHSLDEIGTVPLVNGVEMYSNQDLGLVITSYELPETGGSGTTLYIIGGLLLMTASAIFLWCKKKGNRK